MSRTPSPRPPPGDPRPHPGVGYCAQSVLGRPFYCATCKGSLHSNMCSHACLVCHHTGKTNLYMQTQRIEKVRGPGRGCNRGSAWERQPQSPKKNKQGEDREWRFQALAGRKLEGEQVVYLVKWEPDGVEEFADTWEPVSCFENSAEGMGAVFEADCR